MGLALSASLTTLASLPYGEPGSRHYAPCRALMGGTDSLRSFTSLRLSGATSLGRG